MEILWKDTLQFIERKYEVEGRLRIVVFRQNSFFISQNNLRRNFNEL